MKQDDGNQKHRAEASVNTENISAVDLYKGDVGTACTVEGSSTIPAQNTDEDVFVFFGRKF